MDAINDTAAAPPPPVFAELDPEIVEKALDQARAEQEKKKDRWRRVDRLD